MFYAKNLPAFERVLRIAVGVGLTFCGMLYLKGASGGFWGLVLAASGVGVVLTGFLGFCPFCALAGRKQDKNSRAT